MNSWFVRIHFCFFVSALSKGGFSIHTVSDFENSLHICILCVTYNS